MYLTLAIVALVAVIAVIAGLLRQTYAPPQPPVAVIASATAQSTQVAAVPDANPTGQPPIAATAPSRQTAVAVGTQVSIPKVGLSVQLPGSAWVRTTPGDYPGTESERWDNPDRSLVFAVFVFDDKMREGHKGLKEFGEEFAHEFQLVPIGESKDEMFQGQRAWRIEGTGLGQQETFGPEYRFVEYWIEKEGIYLIVAGAKADQWQNGGAEKVEAILGSVRFTR